MRSTSPLPQKGGSGEEIHEMITIFGSINMDLIANVERLPEPGETVSGYRFSTAAGGKGANQALAARRAGAAVRMVGAVGSDAFANDALALLAEAGADLTLVRRRSDVATGTAHILVDQHGENVIAVVPGANGSMTVADADAAVAATPADGTLMVQLELPPATVEQALTAARAKGIRTLINTAPLTADAPRLARLADIVIANETEFERLALLDDASAFDMEGELRRIHAATGQSVIVTLGADGVIAVHDGEIQRASGLRIEPVDTVGAGDTFCGYLAASLDSGVAFADALRCAAVAGSLACLKPGAQPSIPLAAEVTAHL